jgi:hypothetical protein
MAEILESQATGDLARIYDEIRTYSAVPYVSSLQRHVATKPNCLEYAWAACRPAFLDGTIPETAWKRAAMVDVQPFPKLSRAALRLMGVDESGLKSLRNICENFIRVSPINLLLAGIVEKLIQGAKPQGRRSDWPNWTPPKMLDPLPALPNMGDLPKDQHDLLMQLGTMLGGSPFVPGLYRLFAPWPAYMAHAVTLVEPVLKSDSEREKRRSIATNIIAAADGIIADLPPVPGDLTPPTAEQGAEIVSAIHTYRVTSPEMVTFGTLLRDALPD